jgi:hypothetical protein
MFDDVRRTGRHSSYAVYGGICWRVKCGAALRGFVLEPSHSVVTPPSWRMIGYFSPPCWPSARFQSCSRSLSYFHSCSRFSSPTRPVILRCQHRLAAARNGQYYLRLHWLSLGLLAHCSGCLRVSGVTKSSTPGSWKNLLGAPRAGACAYC